MRTDRILAINLRKQSKSYNDINKTLGISKSTLSGWFKNNQWSQDIKKSLTKKAQIKAIGKLRLMAIANKSKWDNWHEECKEEARKEFDKLRVNPIFLAGLMLYWGEGEKILKSCVVRLGNSDPEMIKIFYLFLLNIGVQKEKIFIHLLLYPDLADKTLKAYWSKVTNIPPSQFRKSTIIQGRHPERRLSYGVCTLYVCSRKFKEKILTWIFLYNNFLQNVQTMQYNTVVK